MTWRHDDYETFDPYASSTTEIMELKNITVSGKKAEHIDKILKVIRFDDVNKDGFSSGQGAVNHIILAGKQIK